MATQLEMLRSNLYAAYSDSYKHLILLRKSRMITKNKINDKAPRRPEFSVGLNNKMKYETPKIC